MIMIEYFIKSYHEIYVDDYSYGELDHVNGYNMTAFIKAPDVGSAIQQYIENCLYYKFNHEYLDIIGDDWSSYYNVLVDEDSNEATESERELWKQGELKLYNNQIRIEAYIVLPVPTSAIQY
jgi:hypothetical protein